MSGKTLRVRWYPLGSDTVIALLLCYITSQDMYVLYKNSMQLSFGLFIQILTFHIMEWMKFQDIKLMFVSLI